MRAVPFDTPSLLFQRASRIRINSFLTLVALVDGGVGHSTRWASVFLTSSMGIPRTGSEWEAETDADRLARCYRGKAWFPKLRLYAVACCRRMWDLIPDGPLREVVEAAERYANEEASKRELTAARAAAGLLLGELKIQVGKNTYRDKEPESSIAWAACNCAGPAESPAIHVPRYVLRAMSIVAYDLAIAEGNSSIQARTIADSTTEAEKKEQTKLLRKIVGNPFVHPDDVIRG